MKKLLLFLMFLLCVFGVIGALYTVRLGNTPLYTNTTQENKPTYTFEEVKAHNSSDDCYSSIDGIVYNFTDWVNMHPGGAIPIQLFVCGKDATVIYSLKHDNDEKAQQAKDKFSVGTLVEKK